MNTHACTHTFHISSNMQYCEQKAEFFLSMTQIRFKTMIKTDQLFFVSGSVYGMLHPFRRWVTATPTI